MAWRAAREPAGLVSGSAETHEDTSEWRAGPERRAGPVKMKREERNQKF